MTPARPFRLQHWLVEPSLNQIGDGHTSVRLAPKFMQVLVCLAERPGKVVTREELLDRVWAGTFVGEAVLTRAVSELRKVFGDDPREPEVIETILKTGYRLLVPVEPVEPVPLPQPAISTPQNRRSEIERRSQRRTLVAAAAALVVFGFMAVDARRPASEPVPPVSPDMQTTSLTSFVGEEYDPALSPDGERVAFIWEQHEGTQHNGDLYVQSVDGRDLVQLTDDAAQERHPAWSPDGARVAYVRCEADDSALYVVAATGGLAQKLTDLFRTGCAAMPSLTWSPDGKWIAFADQAGPQGPHQVAMLSVETFERRAVTEPLPTTDGDGDPVFSPDGRMLAFTRDLDGTRGVYVMPAEGGTPRPLTDSARAVEGLDWTADGESVVFASDGQLWHVALAGGPPVGRGTSDRYRTAPSTARDNARIAYEQASYDVNVYAMTLGAPSAPSDAVPTKAERILNSTRVDGDPRISPDGQRIAFISDRAGSCGLWVARRDGSQPTLLTTFASYCMAMAFPRWSPDGRHLAFVAEQDGQQEIYTISMVSRTQRRITHTASSETMPSWSADGQALYFASDRTGRWEVWRQPVEEGTAQQVTTDGGYVAYESPDGRDVFFTRADAPGVWQQPRHGGTAEQIFDAITPRDGLNWRVVEGGFYFIDRDGPNAFAFFDLAERQAHRLAEIPTPSCLRADIAPDGSWAAFAQVDHGGRDLVLVEPRAIPSPL